MPRRWPGQHLLPCGRPGRAAAAFALHMAIGITFSVGALIGYHGS